jgi:isoleucyl-tRNA synthetase
MIRNTLRFQISNLFDFEASRDALPPERMDALDRWALNQAAELSRACGAAYDAYEFHRVYQLCNQFCSVTLSATYHDIVKDRLYTLGTSSPLRRSSQSAIHGIFGTLVRILAPVIPFTTDEAWSFAGSNTEFREGSVHLQDWPAAPASWTLGESGAEFASVLRMRAKVNEALESLRAARRIGKSLDAAVTLLVPEADPMRRAFDRYLGALPEIFIVSEVKVSAPAEHGAPFGVSVSPCSDLGHVRCPRCWRWVPALVSHPIADVCPRCAEALGT